MMHCRRHQLRTNSTCNAPHGSIMHYRRCETVRYVTITENHGQYSDLVSPKTSFWNCRAIPLSGGWKSSFMYSYIPAHKLYEKIKAFRLLVGHRGRLPDVAIYQQSSSPSRAAISFRFGISTSSGGKNW